MKYKKASYLTTCVFVLFTLFSDLISTQHVNVIKTDFHGYNFSCDGGINILSVEWDGSTPPYLYNWNNNYFSKS